MLEPELTPSRHGSDRVWSTDAGERRSRKRRSAEEGRGEQGEGSRERGTGMVRRSEMEGRREEPVDVQLQIQGMQGAFGSQVVQPAANRGEE